MSAVNILRHSVKSHSFRTPLPGFKNLQRNDPTKLGFADFCEGIPRALSQKKELGLAGGSADDPVMKLFQKLDTSAWQDWLAYAHADPTRLYTRNLIDTDNETFTLLLLCWNPGKESPIHDHPSDGCWLKVLQGSIQERRYKHLDDNEDNPLYCYQDLTAREGDLMYMEDSLGYHKVGNPSEQMAVSLHLYSPPIQRCRAWASEVDSPKEVPMINFSEYGYKLSPDGFLLAGYDI